MSHHPALIALAAAVSWLTAAQGLAQPSWQDSFYQYRLPVTVSFDRPGRHEVPLSPAGITSAINRLESMPYGARWFAWNHLRVYEVEPADGSLHEREDVAYHLVAEDQELIPADQSLDGQLELAVEPGQMYLLRYTASGGSRSPMLQYEPVFPVGHALRRHAFEISHEPRYLPMSRVEREVLFVPNTATLTLELNGRFVKGLEAISLRRARIGLFAEAQQPGRQTWVIYYQPLNGHFITIPERRADDWPAQQASLDRLGEAEKYLGDTAYALVAHEAASPWFADTTVKLAPTAAPPAARRTGIRVTAAANERQSFQLVLTPRRAARLNSVEVSSLRSQAGAVLATDDAVVQRVAYVPINRPSYISPVNYTGPLADPLLPLEPTALSPITGNLPLWVTLHVPAGTAAGVYRGELTVAFEDAPELVVPLELEVYGFELPPVSPFRSSMGGPHLSKAIGDSKTIADYHRVTSIADLEKLAGRYFDVMATHKFTPHNVMQYTPIGLNWTPPPQGFNVDAPDNHIQLHDWDFTELNKALAHYIDDLKVNAFTLVHTNPSVITMFKHLPGEPLAEYDRHPPHSSLHWQNTRQMTHIGYDKRPEDDYIEVTRDQFDHVVMQFYRGIAENLEKHGWLDYAYILIDETAYRGYEPYLHFMRLLKSDPLTARIRIAWCIQSPAAWRHQVDGRHAFEGLVDIYIPETNENHHFWEPYYFTDHDIEPARQKLWNYVTYTTRVAIDTPGINNRQIALEVFKNGGGGFLEWATFIWDSKAHHESNHDNPWEEPWTRWGNGAMAYFYPPHKAGVAPQKTFDVVPSVRVMTYRESVDDYEYAWLLERAVEQAEDAGRDATAARAVLDDIRRLYVGSVHWSQNDAWYLELRDRMARAIVDLTAR